MATPILVTGDDTSLSVTLKKNGQTFNIDTGATVQASLVTPNHIKTIMNPVGVLSTATGADWTNSLIVIELTSAETGAITDYGDALLEIQVDDSGKTTFFANINVTRGTIT